MMEGAGFRFPIFIPRQRQSALVTNSKIQLFECILANRMIELAKGNGPKAPVIFS